MSATVTIVLVDGRRATTKAHTVVDALTSLLAWAGDTPIARITGSSRRGLAVLDGGAS